MKEKIKEKIASFFSKKNIDLICILVSILIYIATLYRFHRADKTMADYSHMVIGVCLMFLIAVFVSVKSDINFVKWYKDLDELYKKTFWIVFGGLTFVFSFHIYNMMWGNHDWWVLINGSGLLDYIHQGRYGQTLIKKLFFNGQYVPVLMHLLSFASLSLANILICLYWNLPRKLYVYVLNGLLLFLQPFILAWFYFTKDIPDNLCIPLFSVLSLMLIEKGYDDYGFGKCKLSFIKISSAILLTVYTLSIFPVAVNTLATLFFGKIFIASLNEKFHLNLRTELKKYFVCGCGIAIGGIFYKLSLIVLQYYGKFNPELYNTKSLAIAKMLPRFLKSVKIAFRQLYSYEFSFMPNYLTEIFTILLIILIVAIVIKYFDNKKKYLFCFLFLLLTLISPKISCCLGDSAEFWQPRIDFFGIPFFRGVIVSGLFVVINRKTIRCFVNLLLATVLWVSVVGDFNAQKVWKLGFNSAMYEYNRILTRLEMDPNYRSDKKYYLIQIGDIESERFFYHKFSRKERLSCDLISHKYNLSPWWGEEFIFRKKDLFSQKYVLNSYDKKWVNDKICVDEVLKLYRTGVFSRILEAQQSKHIIQVHDNVILDVCDFNVLRAVVKVCKEISNEK